MSEGVRRFFFRPDHRLLTKRDFSQVFDNCSLRVARGPIMLLAVPNDRTHPRLGLVVRKKFIKSAVGRNTFKRIARESFRLNQYDLPLVDIVVLNRAGSDTLTNRQLQRLFAKAFHALAQQANP